MQYAMLIKSAHRSRSRNWDDNQIFTCFYLIQLSLKQKQKQFFKIINETSSARINRKIENLSCDTFNRKDSAVHNIPKK